MAKKIKPITIKEVIRWLKLTRISHFSYYNEGNGCLFTRYMKYKTKDETAHVLNGGGLRIGGRSYWDIVPFHNSFWNEMEDYRLSITRKDAITRLESIQSQFES